MWKKAKLKGNVTNYLEKKVRERRHGMDSMQNHHLFCHLYLKEYQFIPNKGKTSSIFADGLESPSTNKLLFVLGILPGN